MMGLVRLHEREDLPGIVPVSRANQAAAFFKISRSSRSWRFSRRSWRSSPSSKLVRPSSRRPSSRSAWRTQLRIADAEHSNSRASSPGARPVRTSSTAKPARRTGAGTPARRAVVSSTSGHLLCAMFRCPPNRINFTVPRPAGAPRATVQVAPTSGVVPCAASGGRSPRRDGAPEVLQNPFQSPDFSTASATCSTVRSSKCRPVIIMPIGRSSSMAQGTLTEGCPVTSNCDVLVRHVERVVHVLFERAVGRRDRRGAERDRRHDEDVVLGEHVVVGLDERRAEILRLGVVTAVVVALHVLAAQHHQLHGRGRSLGRAATPRATASRTPVL